MDIAYKKLHTRCSPTEAISRVADIAEETLDLDSMRIPPGWSDLVVDLVDDLQRLDASIRITRLHCWYGGMSVHVSHGGQDVFARLFWAEHRAFSTCEVCGRRGELLPVRKQSKVLCLHDAKAHLHTLNLEASLLPRSSRFRFQRFFSSLRRGSAKKWV